MKQRVKLIIITLFFLSSIFLLFIWQGVYLPKDVSSAEDMLFLVEQGQSLFQISSGLEKEGIIKNRFLFDLHVILKGAQTKLQAGQYLLSPSMSILKIAKKIVSGDIVKIKVTIPEGYSLKDIENNVTKQGLVTLEIGEFKNEFQFLKDAPDDAPLEGFLFPDTYYFSYQARIKEIVRKMLANFDNKLTADLREEIKKQGKTIFEIVTMASLLEKEVTDFEDKKLVSGILWKRLKNKIPLQVDATITYITGKKTIKVSKEDTQIDSPYNTYKYLGLPLGPICNPGIDSIMAAIYPEDSEYWYYLSAPAAEGEPRPDGREGETIFSRTLEEHNIAKARYLK
ncbi:MAG: endolytic transglycosylase MltG [Candidatus Paceibacterales bacterium]